MSDQTPASSADSARPALSSFGHFNDLQFLGQGGMGWVYRAFDVSLNRVVALKFIRGTDPDLEERLLFEARAQARIEHPNVCRVYEAGKIDDRPFIAMQYIEGSTLKELESELTREQKVEMIRLVAEALHAAHRTGVIHRDLKPTNVMVERGPDGELVPYVMDFGLAREVQAPGLTVSGMIVGSPWYMPPEQVRGEVRQLDRRSDVYSIGVTLYELLTGRLPFESDSGVEVMMKTLNEEPAPPSRFDNTLPGELQTIILKCLEKEPSRRYDSARALAEDLRRYQEGEPIQARGATLAYRFWKKARKNRTLSITLAAAIVICLALLFMWMNERRTAQQQAVLAQRFGEQLAKMDSILRLAYALPLHDTRPEKETIRTLMKEMEAQSKALGAAGTGPGQYAVGRGHLGLQEYEKARERLTAAWEAGYREPQVSYALGLTLGRLYQKELEGIESISNREMRETRRKEVETQYRNPAIEYLRETHATEAAPAYVEGLIAFYEKNYDRALAKAEESLKQNPWYYEAQLLAGDVFTAKGDVKRHEGDPEKMLEEYEKGARWYEQALRVGESDPRGYRGLCALWGNAMMRELRAGGTHTELYRDRAMTACANARTADPEQGDIYAREARALWIWAQSQHNRGKEYLEPLDRSIRLAREGMTVDPDNIHILNALGNALSIRIEHELDHNLNPEKFIDEAILSYQRAIAINPSPDFLYSNLAVIYSYRAEYEESQGLDPTASRQESIRNSRESLRRNPQRSGSHSNLAIESALLAQYRLRKGEDPGTAIEDSIRSAQTAIQANPEFMDAYANLGFAYLIQAEQAMMQGRSGHDSLSKAREALQDALEISPDHILIHKHLLSVECKEVELAAGENRDPSREIAAAEKQFQQLIRLNPDEGGAHADLAAAYAAYAGWLHQQNKPSNGVRQKALNLIEKTLQRDPKNHEALDLRSRLEDGRL